MKGENLAKWLESDYDKDQVQPDDALSQVLEVADNFQVAPIDSDALLKAILPDEPQKSQRSGRRVLLWAAPIMAIAAIFLVCTQFIFNKIEVLAVESRVHHVLADQSKVHLNKNSRLSFKKSFRERTVHLEGEAFFEVEKGSPFEVFTPAGNVLVLGTSFNVFARDKHFVVACKTGRVEVSSNGKSIVLEPGEQVHFMDTMMLKETVLADKIDAWQQNETFFQSISLSAVIQAFASWYGLEVKGASAAFDKRKITGFFVHDDLQKAAKMIFLPMGIEYDLKNGVLQLEH